MTTTPAPTLGQPVVVWDHYVLCDGRDHEFRVITDGYRAFAEDAHGGPVTADTFTRAMLAPGSIGVLCPVVDQVSGERCGGVLAADLTTDWWEPATGERLTFLSHGDRIED